MADLYGSHFEFAGTSSRTYGLIFANVESSRYNAISGSISSISVFNRGSKRRYLVDTDYSDYPTSFEIDIVTDDEHILTLTERRYIEKWLFNRPRYCTLYLDVDDDCEGETYETIDGAQKRLYLNCRFINPTKLEYNGGVVGYQVTLETDSGMWWQDAIENTINPISQGGSGSSFNFTVTVDTDLDDYTYPYLVIDIANGQDSGSLQLVNVSDDSSRFIQLANVAPGSRIKFDGELNRVDGIAYGDLFEQHFPRLINGTNNIYVYGDGVSVSRLYYSFNNRRRF